MGFLYYKTYEKDSIADGGEFGDKWTADTNLVLKRIHIKRKTGEALTKSSFYLKIHERVHTHPIVPASILGPDILVSPILDLPFKTGESLDFLFKNLEGATIDIFISFEAWAL